MDNHITSKSCSRCKQTKPIEAFCRDRGSKDGLNSWCKQCVKEYYGYGERSNAYTDVPDGFKRCARCKIVLSKDSFNKHHRAKDGLQTYCRDCQSALNGYEQRKIFGYEGVPQGYKRCLCCKVIFPATIEYFNVGKNAFGLRSQCKQCQANKYLDWYLKHADTQREAARIYRQNNPRIIRERNKHYRNSHPDKVKVFKIRREDRKNNRVNDFTDAQWIGALKYFDGRCAVCGRPPGLWHIIAMDHWIPLAHPGCPGTTVTNIVPLCHGVDGCNNSKKDKLPDEWLEQKFGKRKARMIKQQIEVYFQSVVP